MEVDMMMTDGSGYDDDSMTLEKNKTYAPILVTNVFV
jgi:hypothetical protein